MAITQNTFTGNGSNLGPFSFTFKWLESTDIKVTVGGVLKTAGTHYNLQALNYTTKDGGQVLFTAGNAPANNASIRIYRDTDDSALSATFFSGSAIRAQDLNDDFTQTLYSTQEVKARYLDRQSGAMESTYVPNTSTSVVTKGYMETNYGVIDEVGFTRWRQTASAAQTTFTGAGSYGGVLSYVPTKEQVYLNGALQQRDADYAASNGTSIVFNVALTAGDVVDVVCVNNLTASTVSDAANISYGGQFTGQSTRTVAAKLGDVVSVKDFGAVGDGVADDTVAIQAALNAGRQTGVPPSPTPFYQNKFVVYIPKGIYKTTSALVLPAGVSLHMDAAAEIIAAAAMSAVITTEEASYTDLHNFTFIRGGKINCANLAQSAIWAKYFAHFTIDSVQTWNATVQHINLGSLSAPSSSYEAFIHNCLLRRDLTAYPTNLVGILFTRCGDSHITDVIIMGVRIGIQGPVYDSKFTKVHVWNPFPITGYANTANGVALGIGFSITGGENIFSQCQVDGPLVDSGSGWYLTQPRNSLIGCSVNAVAVNDLQCQGAYLDTGAYTTVIGCTFKGGGVSNRLSAEVAGPGVAGSTVIGNFTSNVATPVGDRGIGISRAWVVYDGTNTPSIRKSKGVSSITDLGTGHWRVNFSSPMLNTDYVATYGGHNSGLASNALLVYGDARSTTYLEVKGWDPVVGTLADSTYINVDIKESV